MILSVSTSTPIVSIIPWSKVTSLIDYKKERNFNKVIETVGYPKNKSAAEYLLGLFMDVNWPGTESAFRIVSNMDKEFSLPLIEENIFRAYKEKDYPWLAGLKRLVMHIGVSPERILSNNVYKLLVFSDW